MSLTIHHFSELPEARHTVALGAVKSASAIRRGAFSSVALLYTLIIYAGPAGVIAVTAAGFSGVLRMATIAMSPILYALLFVTFAGVLARLHARYVVAGKFARDTGTELYFHRRLYGLCWTSVCYFVPIYAVALSVPFLKKVLFRLFGYEGSLDFVTYPDTWIRDLPLLRIEKGAHLSSKATIGTNVVLNDGTVLVGPVHVSEGGLVGHLAMLAPGVSMGPRAQVGVGVAVGINSRLMAGAQVGPGALIEHNVVVGENTRVGAKAYVGTRSKLGPNLVIPGGAVIPPNSTLETQEDVSRICR
ncbi:MAG TPA: hypothetical protein VM580_15125 [Labilithrix sp.]|nr:hypothetical protein [Labilithrix sp.]